jgi:hypothetical protein
MTFAQNLSGIPCENHAKWRSWDFFYYFHITISDLKLQVGNDGLKQLLKNTPIGQNSSTISFEVVGTS